jgi:glycosyltransferase involved in cell wall biosynthesis
MKVLWVTNTVFPDLCADLNIAAPNIGGWMYDLAKNVASSADIELAVVTNHEVSGLFEKKIKDVTYFLIPGKIKKKYPKHFGIFWEDIVKRFKPDVVHIHGSEFPRAHSLIDRFPHLRYVVSIQGMPSVYARYFFGGLSRKDVIINITFRDIIRANSLLHIYNDFKILGKLEVELLQKVKNVIGRTSWDYAHTKSINSAINYFYCGEQLRSSFYSAPKWDVSGIERYSIFLSQAYSPLKGLHQVLDAIAKLKKQIPEIKIYIAGNNITKCETIKQKLTLTGYGRYLRKKISALGLKDNIVFTGSLNENEMINMYRKAHVFLCPSSIENSPNSLAEAQIIGTPLIATYAGGIPDMVDNNVSGILYRFEEIEMLRQQLEKLFNDDSLLIRLSKQQIKTAESRHNSADILSTLLSIYKQID